MTTVSIHPRIAQMRAYVPGIRPEQEQLAIKLNQNENPYPPSPAVQQWLAQMDMSMLQQYPEARCDALREAIARSMHVPADQIVCGNGSDHLITLLFQTFLQEGDTVALPYPTFTRYETAAQIAGIRMMEIQTNESFEIDVKQLAAADAKAVMLVNPNAPTGIPLSREQMERLLRTFRGLVVVDEAYIDFAPAQLSVLPLIDQYPNLIVLRTFSKAYALSGARVGYAVGAKPLIEAIWKPRETFCVNAIAQHLAALAIADQAYVAETSTRIAGTREQFRAGLLAMGWNVLPSVTNFVLATPPDGQAKRIYDALREHHIYVRYFAMPRLDDKLRISIGTPEQMEYVLEVLREL